MTFASEVIRHKFHALPAAEQYEWVMFEESLTHKGEMLFVSDVSEEGEVSTQVIPLGLITGEHSDL